MTDPSPSALPPGSACEVGGSRHFTGWLAGQRVGLAFTTCEAGKLFLVGQHPDGRLAVVERTFPRCTGLWADGQTLWLGTQYQLWRFENFLAAGQRHQGADRLYVPKVGHTTGDLDTHDVAVEDGGRVVFVATRFNCLATLSERLSFTPLWRPPFVSKLAAEDRCHLNGLALADGRARYVTAVGASDVLDGWRDHRGDGGCVVDVTTNGIVAAGLSMPHSPRVYGGTLWVLNSGTGYFGRIDLTRGTFEPVAFCPGYLRGLAFVGDYAVVGLSKARRDRTFQGLALEEALRVRGAEAQCALHVINLRTGDAEHFLRVEGVVGEIYDVAVLPGALRPIALGFKTAEIQQTIAVDQPGAL